MSVFDLNNLDSFPYECRKNNVFYEAEEFKTRVIELKPGQAIPDCQMASYVIFYVVQGDVQITRNGEQASLKEHQVLITEPAVLSMRSESGARLMGIQIHKGRLDEGYFKFDQPCPVTDSHD